MITSIIELAQSRGSAAKTKAGAKKYLLANLPGAIDGLKLNKYCGQRAERDYTRSLSSMRGKSKAQYKRDVSRARLAARAAHICTHLGLQTRDQLHATKSAYAPTKAQLAIVRILAGAHASCPVYIGSADNPPTQTGYSYSKTQWSYSPSTLRVEVGADWLAYAKGKYQLLPTRTVIAIASTILHGLTINEFWSAKTSCGTVHGYLVSMPRRDDYHSLAGSPKQAAKEAIAAWKKQAAIETKRIAENTGLSTVWVSPADSLNAGNCLAITKDVADKIRRRLGGNVGAVRADYLLAMRDDTYVRRAIRAAQTRGAQHA